MTFLEALALAKRGEFLISPSETCHPVRYYVCGNQVYYNYLVIGGIDVISVADLLGEWDVAALKSVSREKGTET